MRAAAGAQSLSQCLMHFSSTVLKMYACICIRLVQGENMSNDRQQNCPMFIIRSVVTTVFTYGLRMDYCYYYLWGNVGLYVATPHLSKPAVCSNCGCCCPRSHGRHVSSSARVSESNCSPNSPNKQAHP